MLIKELIQELEQLNQEKEIFVACGRNAMQRPDNVMGISIDYFHVERDCGEVVNK